MKTFDPITFLNKADNFTNAAYEAIEGGLNYSAINNLKKSNRALMKIVAGMSDTSKVTFPSEFSQFDKKEMISSIILLVYKQLSINYRNLIGLHFELNDFEEGKKYINSFEKFTDNVTKLEQSEEFYMNYLEGLIVALQTLEELNDFQSVTKYLKIFIDVFIEALRLGYNLNEDIQDNSPIVMNYYRELIRNNEKLLSEAIDTMLETLSDSSLTIENFNTLDWFNFSVYNLNTVAQHFSSLILDKEQAIHDILCIVTNMLNISNSKKITEDEDFLKSLLYDLKRCSYYFSDPTNVNDLYELNLDLIEINGQEQNTNHVILSLQNAIDFLHSVPALRSDFELLKLYNRLIGQLGISLELDLAKEHHETVLTLLQLVDVNDVLRDHVNYGRSKAENELKLARAESYYFLASNEIEAHNIDKGKNYLLKSISNLNSVDDSYKSDLKTNLTKLILSLERYLQNLSGQRSFFDF